MKKTALLTTGPGLASGNAWTKPILPNDRINVGLIGCRNQGISVLREFLQAGAMNCLVICDIDQQILDDHEGELIKVFSNHRKFTEISGNCLNTKILMQ